MSRALGFSVLIGTSPALDAAKKTAIYYDTPFMFYGALRYNRSDADSRKERERNWRERGSEEEIKKVEREKRWSACRSRRFSSVAREDMFCGALRYNKELAR